MPLLRASQRLPSLALATPQRASDVIEGLLDQAIRDNERSIAWIRLAIALLGASQALATCALNRAWPQKNWLIMTPGK